MPPRDVDTSQIQTDRKSLDVHNSLWQSVWLRMRLPLVLLYCRVFGINRPAVVVLTVNNNCNWNCTYCYGDYPNKGTEKNLTTQQLTKTIDELAEAGCVYMIVHGGEALLRKDIGYIVDYIKTKRIYVGLITNGQLFPRRINELRNVDSITFSLDGRPENNDKNRGPGTYDYAMTAIKLALKEGFKVRVSATLSKHNKGDVPYIAKLAKEVGFPVSFSILFRTDLSLHDDPLNLAGDEIREVLGEIKKYKKLGCPLFTSYRNLEHAMNWPYEQFNKLYLFKDQVPQGFKHLPCFYSKLKFHMEGDGTVMPCTVLSANSFTGRNVLDEGGVKAAVDHVIQTNNCVACPHLTQSEWNLLMGMSPGQISYLLREQIKEITRRF